MAALASSLAKGERGRSREFDTLVRAIGECKSKAEEDAIVAREVEVLKPRLRDAGTGGDGRTAREALVRLAYVEMLGHDAAWGHVRALQACSDANLLTKKAGRRRAGGGGGADVGGGGRARARPASPAHPPAHALSPPSRPPARSRSPGHRPPAPQVAYLTSTLFLDHRSDLIILVVNTLARDLASDNFLVGKFGGGGVPVHCPAREGVLAVWGRGTPRHAPRTHPTHSTPPLTVCAALTAATRLIGPDTVTAVLPAVTKLLAHPKELVRKKAVLALQRFIQLDPRGDGALGGLDVGRALRGALCDKDPAVMGAALCALHDLARADPVPLRNLVPSLVSILKQARAKR